MSYNIDEKSIAVNKCFENKLDIRKTISEIGYPSYSALYSWICSDKKFDDFSKQKYTSKYNQKIKQKAVEMVKANKYSQVEIANILGVKTPASISKWARDFEKKGKITLMDKNHKIDLKINPNRIDVDSLSDKEKNDLIRKLELEADALKAINEVLFSGRDNDNPKKV